MERTNEGRLKFAVEFATADLDEYREGDWLNLIEDLKGFLGVFDLGDVPVDVVKIGRFVPMVNPDPSRDDVRKIQSDLLDLLSFAWNRVSPALEIAFQYNVMRIPHIDVPVIVRSGTFRDCVLGVMLRLLEIEGAASIVQCPDCLRLFYRRGKMVFCSTRCTNRAMVKRKRAGNAKPRPAKVKTKATRTARRMIRKGGK